MFMAVRLWTTSPIVLIMFSRFLSLWNPEEEATAAASMEQAVTFWLQTLTHISSTLGYRA
jgi:hypothetical protein